MLFSFSQLVPYPERVEDSTLQLLQPMKGLVVKSLLARAGWPGSATRAIDAISVAGSSLARTALMCTGDLRVGGVGALLRAARWVGLRACRVTFDRRADA